MNKLTMKYDGRFTLCIPGKDGEYCFRADKDDAAYIFKCVSMHGEILNILRDAVEMHSDWDGGWVKAAREVLAKAEAEVE